MPYTTEDGGRLNNFAIEPKIYQEDAPTQAQKRNYVVLGIAGAALVAGLIVVAYAVSHVS